VKIDTQNNETSSKLKMKTKTRSRVHTGQSTRQDCAEAVPEGLVPVRARLAVPTHQRLADLVIEN
jgi:hypothetical protein